jgi:NAD(P)-dependent dehydrogenase (short-subunit alcohol dehydrogenase family)
VEQQHRYTYTWQLSFALLRRQPSSLQPLIPSLLSTMFPPPLPLQAEAQHMLSQGVGKIINTASMASLLVPHPQKQAAYNASKAAGKSLPGGQRC